MSLLNMIMGVPDKEFLPMMPKVRIGSGRRTLYTIYRAMSKSHAGKPKGYVKPNVVKSAR